MRNVLMMTAAVALLIGFAAPSYAQKIDANGRCHDEHGKFAKMEVCKGHAPEHHYALDKKGKCRDEGGRFAKAGFCH